MATISHPFLCFQPSHPNHTCSCSSVPSIPTVASRFLSLRKNPLRGFHSCSGSKLTLKINPLVPNAKEETLADTNRPVSQKKAKRNKILSSSSFTEIVASLFYGFRNVLKFDELGLEILSIALPAVLAIAADPLTSLVDSAYIGHVGSIELAAVGVSISVFNLVAKLFNIPLLNITTSFVAEEQAKICDGDYNSVTVEKSDSNVGFATSAQELMHDKQSKKLLPAVSASLALAAGIGIAEAVALSIGSGSLMNIMGVPVDSPMHLPAEQFLTLRAFGAPAVVIALAAQGTFRGFMDTKTPLYAVDMPRGGDIAWEHCTKVDGGKVKCNYYGKVMSGGVTRMKQHLGAVIGEVAACDKVTADLRIFFRKHLETRKGMVVKSPCYALHIFQRTSIIRDTDSHLCTEV